ncbi:hypothetical protein [Streptomyces sp. T028]|uniref:hypothetical protein n=1 Tax=Streptomyces sp. T028 TaxID=3394379 RepID=UPI003A89A47E
MTSTAHLFRTTGSYAAVAPSTERGESSMALIVAAATPFHGHVQPVLTVVSDLVRRGHEVVVLTGSRFAEQVGAAGALHVTLPPAADFDDRQLDLYFPDRSAVPTGPAQLEYDLACSPA